jgi:iron complex outermembrane receptor protein
MDGRLTATGAAYTIDYNNILATDPTDSTGQRQIPVPGIRSRGVELTVQGQVGRLALLAGYGYNRTRLLRTSGLGNRGDTYPNAPKHIANLLGSLDVVRSASTVFSLGGNVRYVSSRIGAIEDQRWFVLPAYALVDASATLRWRDYTANAGITNLFDERYFPGGYFSRLLILLGDRRSVRLAVTRSF